MKKIFLFVLLSIFAFTITADARRGAHIIIVPTSGGGSGGGGGDGGGTCDACNTGNDGRLLDDSDDADSDYGSTAYRSKRITVPGGGLCITAYFFSASDGGNSYDVTFQIYTDDGSSDCNDSLGCPDSLYSADFNATYTNLPDSRTDNEQAIAATTLLPAGTYHIVVYGGGDSITWGVDTGADVGNTNYSADGTNWLATSVDVEMGVMGCAP